MRQMFIERIANITHSVEIDNKIVENFVEFNDFLQLNNYFCVLKLAQCFVFKQNLPTKLPAEKTRKLILSK